MTCYYLGGYICYYLGGYICYYLGGYTCYYLGGYTCNCRLGYELHSDERRCENACGGLIDASNGTITSPSFPDIYPSNKEYKHTQLNSF